MLSRNSHSSNPEGGLGWVQPRDKLSRVARVSPHQRPMISHVRGGQREERLVRLVRGNGCDAPVAEAALGRLCFTALQVGAAAVGAPVAAVCAGADVAGVGSVRAVRGSLARVTVLFGLVVVAVAAGRTDLLVRGLPARTVGAQRRGLSGRRATPLGSRQLLLSQSGGAAAADPGAGGSIMRRIGRGTWGRLPIGGKVTARQPEAHFIIGAAAGGVAADKPFPATLSTSFVVGFEAAFVLQGGALLCELQGGRRRSAAGLLVSLTAGGAQLGGRGIWFSNLRAGLGQEGQWTLLGIQLKQNTVCD